MSAPEVLLIDDDVDGSVLRKRVLELQGYRVQIALDAWTGVVLAQALRPALVMLDHSLHPQSGPEVLRNLKAVLPSTPVISHSGYSGLVGEYVDPVPDAFITKGDSVQHMLATIQELLR